MGATTTARAKIETVIPAASMSAMGIIFGAAITGAAWGLKCAMAGSFRSAG